MSLQLHYFSGSPFAWRVQLALEHKGIKYELNALSVSKGEHRSEAFLTLNPHGRVPVIEHDGFTLYESSAIVEYLEERFPETPRLFPEDIQARAIVRRTISEIETVWWTPAFQIAQNVYFKPSDQWDTAMIARGAQGVGAELDRYESNFEGDFLCGEFGAADLALYPFVAHLTRYDLKKPDLQLVARIGPKTRAWMGRIEALPYFDRTYPPHWR